MKKNLWHNLPGHPEIYVGQYVVPNFMSNSVCIRINEKEFIVMSPGAQLLEDWRAQFPNDSKIHIIFPNAYHYLGVKAWLAEFPNATLYASEIATQQLQTKGFHSAKIQALETTLPPLPDGYFIRIPPSHRAGDVWVCKSIMSDGHNSQSIWMTCDSFLNYERKSNQPIARFLQVILKAAPGLKISQVVKWFIINDRANFKAWVLQKLKEDNPYILIPSHGEIDNHSALAQRLKSVIQARL